MVECYTGLNYGCEVDVVRQLKMDFYILKKERDEAIEYLKDIVKGCYCTNDIKAFIKNK